MEERSQCVVWAWRRIVLLEFEAGVSMSERNVSRAAVMRVKRETRALCSACMVSRSVSGRITQPRLKARVSLRRVSMRQWISESAHGEERSISTGSEDRMDGTTGSQFWMSDQLMLLRA